MGYETKWSLLAAVFGVVRFERSGASILRGVEDMGQKSGWDPIWINQWLKDERGNEREVDGESKEHPSGCFVAKDASGMEGCVFKHGRPPVLFGCMPR